MAVVLCIFCNQKRQLTQEHLISRPISDALGLDRSSTIAEFQWSEEGPDLDGLRLVPLGDLKVRSACRECNNGWMESLETAAAGGFESWLRRGRLAAKDVDVIARWLATRLLVWTMRDGGIRSLEERVEQGEGRAIPHFNRAHRLASCSSDALDGLAIGAAAATGDPRFGFGNASTEPREKGPLTAVLALHFPPIQLWVADGVFESEIRLPMGVRTLKPEMRMRRLRHRGNDVSPDQALARFPSD